LLPFGWETTNQDDTFALASIFERSKALFARNALDIPYEVISSCSLRLYCLEQGLATSIRDWRQEIIVLRLVVENERVSIENVSAAAIGFVYVIIVLDWLTTSWREMLQGVRPRLAETLFQQTGISGVLVRRRACCLTDSV
jgi:hypothetical protein